ncbi:UDP-3-O-(3-hydroxymyristoyl)glucosamine N-acyltransferase [anaerobic digester metagenome]
MAPFDNFMRAAPEIMDVIRSKEDYRFYLEADRIALNIRSWFPQYFTHEVWRFQRRLRRLEYIKNCRTSILFKPYYYYLLWRHTRAERYLGFQIPPNVFGAGLSIAHAHLGCVGACPGARIGENCRIHVGVQIATKAGTHGVCATIGNNAFIGPNVIIIGDQVIGDNVAIGAGAVVTRSFPENDITIGGVPAKKIADKGSQGLYHRSTDILRQRIAEGKWK